MVEEQRMTELRASGKTVGDEIAAEEAMNGLGLIGEKGELGLTGGVVGKLPEDLHSSMAPAWRRMDTSWTSPDHEILSQMRRAVDVMIKERFAECFELFYEINMLVREPIIDEASGEMQVDEFGLPEWQRTAMGAYREDWSRLGYKERENFLYKLTVGLFRWEQRAVDLQGEALLGRAVFEEAFSHGYEARDDSRATIEDRTARARVLAAEYRYRAVYMTYLSKRADAVCRSAERLALRLRDLHTN
jgi:hypothetical protein